MKPAYKMTALSPYPGEGLCMAFRTGGFNSLVGYFQAAVAVLHLP